jgi:hypothetical protein
MRSDLARQKLSRSFGTIEELIKEYHSEESNSSDDENLQNFISAPCSPREKEMLQNPKFPGRLLEFKKAVRYRDLYDNVYAESKPSHYFYLTKGPNVAVQTSLFELLAFHED